jgi:uncharacterized protein YraI
MYSRNSTRSLPALSATMSRRSALRTMAGVGVAAMTITAFGRTAGAQVSPEQHTSQLYATTDYLNLRSGPGTRHSVITVMPPKSIITLNAQEQHGYYSVNYDGRSGWAHRDYLVPAGLASEDPVIIGSARTTDDLNLRSGPGAGHQVMRVAAAGTWVEASDTVENGFRYVVHEGLAGWMADRYLSWTTDGGQPAWYLTTTAALNLREDPSTSARIYLVIPEGSDVRAGDVVANGFRQVTYKGTTGWAHTGFLT